MTRLVACVAALLVLAPVPAASQVRLTALDDAPVDPFAVPPGTRATVFVFTSVECPISNRYAPAMKRLHDTFSPKGVAFTLVYPNPADSPEAIREHLHAYGYPMRALRDVEHDLVKLAGATITPEAAVYDGGRRLAYLGRIDDRYLAIGLQRPSATRHDLADALTAVLAGMQPQNPRLPAVGCFIADFRHH